MDSNSILYDTIQEEVLYYYDKIRAYDETRKIDVVMADDVYAKALEYNMCDAQKDAVMRTGIALNNSNGTVIFAPSKDEVTLVVLSKQVMPQKTLEEIRGTILHELTHAHDFYDFAEYLQLREYNNLFDSEYYHDFFCWTEFHARRIGYKRFLECRFRKGWKQFKKRRCEILGGIRASFSVQSNRGRLYDLMQAAGRYYTFVELCPSHTGNFQNDILENNVETALIDICNDIYFFLSQNSEFEQFIANVNTLDDLLQRINAIVCE